MEQQDLHKRLLLALVLSFAVLVGFSYLFPTPQQTIEQNSTTQVSQQDKVATAPASPNTSNKNAPSSTAASTVQKPAVTTTSDLSDTLVTIKADDFELKIDKFARIKSAVLLKEKYEDEDGNKLEIINASRTMPLEVRFVDAGLNDEAFKVGYTASASELTLKDKPMDIVLTQKLSNVTLTKKIRFYSDGHYDLDISTDKKVDLFITPGHRPEADSSIYMLVRGSLVRDAEGILTSIEDGDAEKTEIIPNATIISSFDRYVATLFYSFDKPITATVTVDTDDDPLPFVQSSQNLSIHGYIGPKDWRTFESIHPDLVNAIEFGWFTFLSKPFFQVMLWIDGVVGNWGWTIILFTLLVKAVLFYPSFKGMMSMQKLKELAPKMKEIKERYGKDPAKMNQHTMELYKKHGANPMGGCLPMLMQIPVFFALYRVLLNADELQGAPWIGWIVNLADQDPYYVLPVLMGISMFFQQKLTPNTMTDPMQKKIFQWFPVLMTFFFLSFPAGLVLYWLTNNLLSIAQQLVINKAFEKQKAQAKLKAKGNKSKD